MISRMMVAGLAIGSLLLVAGLPATQVARAQSETAMSGPMSGMVGGHDDSHATMASMLSMMHQHQGEMGEGPGMMGEGMMGEGMMGEGPGMMGEGMMGEGPGMMGEGMMGEGTGMMGEGMMGEGPGMMGEGTGMMGEAATAPSSTGPETLAPDAAPGGGHEQHHPSPSPEAQP